MSNIVIDIAAQFTGKKAFKDADRTAQKLNQSVKNLAATFGVAFSARAFVNFSKNAMKAFAADDKAARTLTQTLNNLGLAFADTEVKTFISDLEKQFGVLDDLLRPAYQKLITTTGDYRKSQDLLKVALDLSAQSGNDVVSVSNDLSQALIGNMKGLRKYNLGLTTAQLSAMSFEEVLARITKISKGQASLAADTYAGKLDKLKVSAANAEEVLGGAFLDSFIKLSGGDVDKATEKIDKYSNALATTIRLLTGVISKQEVLSKVGFKYGLIPVEIGKLSTNRSASPAGTFKRNEAEIKAAAAAKKLAEDQAKAQKALTKAQQDALKVAKAKAVFDLQKIQIEAALKGKISAEDEIRLKLMKAIEEENLTNVEKYQKALEVAQTKTKELTELLAIVKAMEIADPFGTWKIDPLTASINELTKSINGVGTSINARGTEWSSFANTVAATVLRPNLSEWSSSFSAAGSAASAAASAAMQAQQDALSAQTKAAQDALTAGSKAQQDAFSAQLKSQQEALTAQSAAQLSALKSRLADEAAAYKEAADAAAALFDATGLLGTNDSATRNAGMLALQAAEQAKAAQAALDAVAAQAAAASNSGSGAGNNNINITVNGALDANAVADQINDILTNSANDRGNYTGVGSGFKDVQYIV
jgi:hypothetical protein